MQKIQQWANESRPRLGGLAVVTILAISLSIIYTQIVNPEIRFWTEAANQKIEWREKLSETQKGPVTVVFGGSSTGFGIDAGFATNELDFPMVNLGLHAGVGAEALTGLALSQVQAGDTLLVMLEPELIRSADLSPALGTQLALAINDPAILSWRREDNVFSRVGLLSDCRPGASNLFAMFGKLCLRKPLYRYKPEDLRPGGLMVTGVRGKVVPQKGAATDLGENGRRFFKDLLAATEGRGVNILYAPPWVFGTEDLIEEMRGKRANFLTEVEKYVPVVWEPNLGIYSDRSLFADSAQHLTEEHAAERTRILVSHLRSKN